MHNIIHQICENHVDITLSKSIEMMCVVRLRNRLGFAVYDASRVVMRSLEVLND